MPYNGSGSFTILNTFVPATTILSSAVNANFTDIATGLSDVLTRDGQAGMTAAFKAISGSLAAPSITFTGDLTSGLYLSTTGVVGLVSHSLGVLLNTNVFSAVSATVQAGGTGYAVGDTITTTGGTALSQPIFTVATLSGSAVATVTVTYPGFYTATPSNPVAQGSTSGSGTSCTLNVTYNVPASSDYRAGLTDQAGAFLWQKLGASSFFETLTRVVTQSQLSKLVLQAGSGIAISYSATPTTAPMITATLSPPLVPNYISGLTLSTAGSSGTMSIAAGVANDSTNTVLMNLASAISKTTASWAVGTGNGGLDTGAIAINTWYHFYEIERVDTAVVDVVFSTNATTPTLPTNYTIYRRIGSGRTNASSQWIAFSQLGNEFIWKTNVNDIAAGTATSLTGALFTMTVPTGVQVIAIFTAQAQGTGTFMLVSSPDQNNDAASVTDFNMIPGATMVTQFRIRTDTSARARQRTDVGSSTYAIVTYGWVDLRGTQ